MWAELFYADGRTDMNLTVAFRSFANAIINLKYSLSKHWRRIGWAEVELHSFLTSVPNGGQLSTTGPGRFTPGNERRYPLNRGLGGPQSWSEYFGEELFSMPWFEPRIFHPVAFYLMCGSVWALRERQITRKNPSEYVSYPFYHSSILPAHL